MKVAFLASNLGVVSQPWKSNGRYLMEATGHNIGNMAFWYAANMLVDAEKVLIRWDTKASQMPKDLDALVFPAANFINATAKLDGLTKLIQDLDLPCLLLGIGAQAEQENAPPPRNESVIAFLHEVSKRTSQICVRGDFTQKVCAEWGIDNTVVLGCPSILMNPRHDLGQVIERKIDAPLNTGPYAIHASAIKQPIINIERELVRMARLNPGSTYVVQRPIELIKTAIGEEMGETETAFYNKCANFLGFEDNQPAFETFLRTHLYAPTSIDSWMHYLQRFTAGINTRIHGTIVGTNAGIPSVCITHDTRTRELSRRLALPHIEPKDFMDTRFSIAAMFKRTQFSGEAFDANRRAIAEAYLGVFEKAGIKPSRHLLSLGEPVPA